MNVVFDFGAVLFSWRPADILAETFPALASAPADASALAKAVFGHADWHAFDQGLLAMDEVVDRTQRRLGLHGPTLMDLVAGIGERLRPIDECVDILDGLRQRRDAQQGVAGIYFLSNMPLPYARHLEARHGFLRWFDGGIFSGDVRLIKPDPAIYQALQQRFDLPASRTVFIDDLSANVESAQSLGWRGIHFRSPEQLKEALNKHL